MGRTPTVISTKTLPTSSTLHPTSHSPTHSLLAVSSPSTSTESKVSLYRAGGNSDLVWEWTNVGEPPKPTGGLGLKGKAKAAPVGKVQQLAWSTQGSFLAVAISPATPSSPSTLALLSLHSGQLIHTPPLALPTSASISHLSWQVLQYDVDPNLSSWGIELVRKLPGLPKIVKDGPSTATTAAGAPGGFGAGGVGGPGGSGGAGGGGGGVFGAKQAMLERERAKEAQRVLNIREAAPSEFPTVLSDVRPDEPGGTGDEKVKSMLRFDREEHDETEKTVLCAGDEDGKFHLYLGGSVFLGTVDAGEGNSIAAITVLPSTSSTTKFAIHLSSPTQLSIRDLSLDISPTLQLVLRQSSALRATIQHAFESFQEVRNLWDEARRIGKGWLQRVADVSRPQGVTLPPATQLHLLLATGRPTVSLHDFLASKMNERGLIKWEQAMDFALERLSRVGWMNLEPALERAVVLLMEIDGWARWPEKFGSFNLDRNTILKTIEVAKEAIRATVRMSRAVEEEERCFAAFRSWLHYELDKLAQQEGSEVRPVANFHPLPVSSYITNSLSPQTSPVNPYVSMGLASVSLSQNQAINPALEWANSLPRGEEAVAGERESLDSMLNRLGEELQGQLGRATAGAHERRKETEHDYRNRDNSDISIDEVAPPPFARPTDTVDEARPTTISSSSNTSPPPKSVSVLLHLVAKFSGEVMDEALQTVGSTAKLGASVQRGNVDVLEEEGRKVRRIRTKVGRDQTLREAWIGDSNLYIARTSLDGHASTEFSALRLASSDGVTFRVIEFGFIDDDELVLALESGSGKGSKQFLVPIEIASLEFSTPDNTRTPPLIPLAHSTPLDTHFPPSHVSFASLDGRRIACTLAGEGRRLEVLDLSDAFDSTTDGGDVEMS